MRDANSSFPLQMEACTRRLYTYIIMCAKTRKRTSWGLCCRFARRLASPGWSLDSRELCPKTRDLFGAKKRSKFVAVPRKLASGKWPRKSTFVATIFECDRTGTLSGYLAACGQQLQIWGEHANSGPLSVFRFWAKIFHSESSSPDSANATNFGDFTELPIRFFWGQ